MILVVRQAGLSDLALHPESPREQPGAQELEICGSSAQSHYCLHPGCPRTTVCRAVQTIILYNDEVTDLCHNQVLSSRAQEGPPSTSLGLWWCKQPAGVAGTPEITAF